MFTYRYKYTEPEIRLCGNRVPLKTEMTYFGIVVDRTLLFKSLIKAVTTKAAEISMLLARIMPNVEGPREDRWCLLSAVVHSVLLYGAPAWAHTIDVDTSYLVMCVSSTEHSAECCSGASAPTAQSPSWRSTQSQRPLRRIRRAAITVTTTGVEPNNLTLDKWQERWSTGETGGWTRRLIPDVRSWCNRRYGRTNFHLTQFLSGHGCFSQYLHRI
ncbi:unnamed protein product [Macrosiphum euphorbiae]|uniref:Reverse transcriptase n=1 Tax=Macrosiphum euphorbiae TaxID=13131 RepID=A0AAV0XLU6_9HEMI|nr:unnamed protein product [Macrosiphum euphorbiae]